MDTQLIEILERVVKDHNRTIFWQPEDYEEYVEEIEKIFSDGKLIPMGVTMGLDDQLEALEIIHDQMMRISLSSIANWWGIHEAGDIISFDKWNKMESNIWKLILVLRQIM